MRNNPQAKNAFTLPEILLVVAVITIMVASVISYVNPVLQLKRTRDTRRVSDLQTIERYIIEYSQDNQVPPDVIDITRDSTSLPTGSPGDLYNISASWINADLSPYGTKMYVDPINDATYKYEYRTDGTHYELNCVLEDLTEYMINDGGDDDGKYEVGSNLTIL